MISDKILNLDVNVNLLDVLVDRLHDRDDNSISFNDAIDEVCEYLQLCKISDE